MEASLKRLRQRREELGDEGGFTLIELLIVIVILGILAAIVVFAVQNLTGQSASAACQSEYKTVETALESYKAQMGAYPTSYDQLLTTQNNAVGGGSAGPWLKDAVPTTNTGGGTGVNPNYWFGLDGSGNIIVNVSGTTKTSLGDDTQCSQA
jgi:prepilin-type N-terminal cleavage/methylation domain-containing protein